jgi:hypothetical protein
LRPESERPLRLAAHIANPARSVDLRRWTQPLGLAAALLEAEGLVHPHRAHYGAAVNGPRWRSSSRVMQHAIAPSARVRAHPVAFAAQRVETMVFKSTGAPPSFHYLSSNLDILVPDGRAPIGRKILAEMGYVELLNVEEPRKFLFRRFTGDGSSFAFHLHEVVGWGVPFLDNRPMWARARAAADDPHILIPGPSEGLLVTLAHWFYEDKALSLGNLLLTANALCSLDEALAEPAAHARRRGWEEGFWGALCIFDEAWKRLYDEPLLSAEQRTELEHAPVRYAELRARLLPLVSYGEHDVPALIPFKANKIAYYRKVMRDSGRPIDRKLGDVMNTLFWAVRWRFHVRSQPALLVTLSGCDGSGKSLQGAARGRLRRATRVHQVGARVLARRGALMRAEVGARPERRAISTRARTGQRSGGSKSAARLRPRSRAGSSAWYSRATVLAICRADAPAPLTETSSL